MNNEVIEVSYTGDLLAHRRCPRAWAYEKHVGFAPYEQVQAMEGRLLHHAMEWMTRKYEDDQDPRLTRRIEGPTRTLLQSVAFARDHYRVHHPRRGTRAHPREPLQGCRQRQGAAPGRDRDQGRPTQRVPTARRQKGDPKAFAGKSKILLTGIIDLVLQQVDPLTYESVWVWDDVEHLTGHVEEQKLTAETGDMEIWDFKGDPKREPSTSRTTSVRLLPTPPSIASALGHCPNAVSFSSSTSANRRKRLLAIPVDQEIVDSALIWTVDQVEELRRTTIRFAEDPASIEGGSLQLKDEEVGMRITPDLKAQCTACGQRFDCTEYTTSIGSTPTKVKRDVDPREVGRN